MKPEERSKLREVPAGVDANASTREKRHAEELEALPRARRGERHIIVLQSFPDPDAISSAFAHQMIAARHDIECDIAYDGHVSHHENIAPVELLRIQLLRIGESDDLKGYQGSVFIDTQGTTSGLTERLQDAGVPALAIIDHHEPQEVIKAQFTDIRPDANATATIYTEYIESGLLRPHNPAPGHKRLGAGPMAGIR